MAKLQIILAQMNSGDDPFENLETIQNWIRRAASRKADAILFPENLFFMGHPKRLPEIARLIHKEKFIARICEAASRGKIAVLLGGFPTRSRGSRKLCNTSVWINEYGEILARYRKINLFDVRTPNGQLYKESDQYRSGRRLTVFDWHGCRFGMSICYDLRFPEIYRKLAMQHRAQVLLIPSAFTQETGRAHWNLLLRSRAIENLAYVLAPAQSGSHPEGRKTFGHSSAIHPWGKVFKNKGREAGMIRCSFEPRDALLLRKRFWLTH